MVLMNNLVGKRVYNNSSYAPSQGTVNPQGYIQREINNPNSSDNNQGVYGGVSQTGNDGQSDTRSGLAAQALRRQFNNEDSASSQASGQTREQSSYVPTAYNPNLPEVQITPLGQLKIPFNFKYASSVLNEKQKADASLMKLQQDRQNDLRQYLTSYRDSNKNYGIAQLGSLNNAASTGTVFSSGFGKRIADDATTFNNQITGLDMSEADSRNSANSSRASINDAFKSALSQYANDAGYSLDQSAGGYGLKKKK